jgi:hypothetical protein
MGTPTKKIRPPSGTRAIISEGTGFGSSYSVQRHFNGSEKRLLAYWVIPKELSRGFKRPFISGYENIITRPQNEINCS